MCVCVHVHMIEGGEDTDIPFSSTYLGKALSWVNADALMYLAEGDLLSHKKRAD